MVAGSSPARGAKFLKHLVANSEAQKPSPLSRGNIGGNIRKISCDAPNGQSFEGRLAWCPDVAPGRLSMPLPGPELPAGGRFDLRMVSAGGQAEGGWAGFLRKGRRPFAQGSRWTGWRADHSAPAAARSHMHPSMRLLSSFALKALSASAPVAAQYRHTSTSTSVSSIPVFSPASNIFWLLVAGSSNHQARPAPAANETQTAATNVGGLHQRFFPSVATLKITSL